MINFTLIMIILALFGWMFFGAKVKAAIFDKIATMFGKPAVTPKDMSDKLDKIIELLSKD